MAYVGLAHNCLAARAISLDSAFGPVCMNFETKSASGTVKPSSPVVVAGTLARVAGKLLRARLDGSYRRTPFFNAEKGAPLVDPKVLGREERVRLTPPDPIR